MKRAICLFALMVFISGCAATYRPFPFGWYGRGNNLLYVYPGQDTTRIRHRGYSRYVDYEMWHRDTLQNRWEYMGTSWVYDVAVYDRIPTDKPPTLNRPWR